MRSKTPQEKVNDAQEALTKAQNDYTRIGGPYLFNKMQKAAKDLKTAERKRNLAALPALKTVSNRISLF